jgi:Mn2+/Fe2+ NRAMP family transporter
MGDFANRRLVQIAAILASVLVLGLNFVLLAQTAGLKVPLIGS